MQQNEMNWTLSGGKFKIKNITDYVLNQWSFL